jgi:hypothetical protein
LIEPLLRKIEAGRIPCSMCTAQARSIYNRRPLCDMCAQIARQRSARARMHP